MKMQEIIDNLKRTYDEAISNMDVVNAQTATDCLEKICNAAIKEGDEAGSFMPGGYAYIAISMILDEFKRGTKTKPIHEKRDCIRLLWMSESSAYMRLYFEYNI